MFGLPGDRYNLEFVAHEDGIDGTTPTSENLLVLYFPTAQEQEQELVAGRLRAAGIAEVELDNPWWSRHGALAFPDPDGWRVVLVPTPIQLITSTGAHRG